MKSELRNSYLIFNNHTHNFLTDKSNPCEVCKFTKGNTNKYTVYYNDWQGISHPCYYTNEPALMIRYI